MPTPTVIENLNRIIEVFYFFHGRSPRIIGFSPRATALVMRGLEERLGSNVLQFPNKEPLPPGAFAVVKGIELHTISDLAGDAMVVES